MLFLRLLVELLAGFTLFSDEQERFICNTIQPGCSNVCFDVFSPVSLLRLWLLHLILLCLPHVLFATYVMHKLMQLHRSHRGSPENTGELSLTKTHLHAPSQEWTSPGFHCSYLLVVFVRLLVEMAFGASQFFLFGLSVPKSFLCYEAPCTSGVECYVSKPTEKTLMLNFTLGVTFLSILVSLVDMVTSMKAMVRWRRKREWLTQEISKGEQNSMFTTATDDNDGLLSRRMSPGVSSGDEKLHHPNNQSNTSGPALKSTGSTNEKTQENVSPSPSPLSPAPTPFVLHRHMKPPLYPRPDCRPPPLNLRVPTPPGVRQLDQSSPVGTSSDSSDSQDKRAWV